MRHDHDKSGFSLANAYTAAQRLLRLLVLTTLPNHAGGFAMRRHFLNAVPSSAFGSLVAISIALFTPHLHTEETQRVTHPDYQQAAQYSTQYLRQFMYDTSVTPRWIGKTDQFWYSYRTSQGTSYIRVDPKLGTKTPLFDRVKLASQLMELVQKPLDPFLLTLSRLSVNDEGTKLKFVADDYQSVRVRPRDGEAHKARQGAGPSNAHAAIGQCFTGRAAAVLRGIAQSPRTRYRAAKSKPNTESKPGPQQPAARRAAANQSAAEQPRANHRAGPSAAERSTASAPYTAGQIRSPQLLARS
jgi:hypothetical protein